jgi:hypothetical protein
MRATAALAGFLPARWARSAVEAAQHAWRPSNPWHQLHELGSLAETRPAPALDDQQERAKVPRTPSAA